MKISIFRFSLILLLALLSGCWFTQKSSTGNDTTDVELLHSGVHGNRTPEEPSATWITNLADFEHINAALNKHKMEGGSTLPNVDLQTHGLLLLEMGQKPTGGYAIHFDPQRSRVIENKVVIHVDWNSPAEDMVVTQALTSPFVIIKIPKADIDSIHVFDQDNHRLFELSVP
jgi:PrcB C-terminal